MTQSESAIADRPGTAAIWHRMPDAPRGGWIAWRPRTHNPVPKGQPAARPTASWHGPALADIHGPNASVAAGQSAKVPPWHQPEVRGSARQCQLANLPAGRGTPSHSRASRGTLPANRPKCQSAKVPTGHTGSCHRLAFPCALWRCGAGRKGPTGQQATRCPWPVPRSPLVAPGHVALFRATDARI